MGVDIAKLNNLFADYYNSGEFVTNDLKNNLKKALGALFDELDNGGVKDGKLTSADGLSEEYASLFSITDSTSLTKEEFLSNIDTYVNTLGEKRAKLSETYRKEGYEQPLSAEASKNNGKMVFDMIDGASLDDDYPIVNQYIKQLDKTTVLPFLEGYYEKQSGCEGIIEHLDDEYDGGTIEFSSKKNIITSLMTLAKEEGLTKSLNYIRLENILNKPEYVDNTAKDFNRGHRFNWTGGTPIFGGAIGGAVVGAITGFCTGGPVGAVIGAVVGGAVGYPALGAADQITDNEIIDKAIKGLYAEIKQKQANN